MPNDCDMGMMTQQDAPTPSQTTNMHELTREAPTVRSTGICTVESQTGHIESAPPTTMYHPEPHQPTCSRAAQCNPSTDVAQLRPEPPTTDGHIGSLVTGNSSDSSVFLVTPTQPLHQTQPTSLACSTAACNLQAIPCQQQQLNTMQPNSPKVVLLSANGTMQQLSSAVLQQQHCWNPADANLQQRTGALLATQHEPVALPSQADSAPNSHRRRKTARKRCSRDECTKEMPDEDVCPMPIAHHRCHTDAGSHDEASTSTQTDSLPAASTIWASSPVPDSEDICKQQHVVHASYRQAIAAALPPRPAGKKTAVPEPPAVAPRHVHQTRAQSQSNSIPVARTPRLSKISPPVVDSSDSGSVDSFVDRDSLQSEGSTCPTTLNSATAKRSRRKHKGKDVGTSSSRGSVRNKGKVSSRRRSSRFGLHKDDGHAAGINGHLSPLLDASPTTSMQRAETPDWNLRRTPVSAGSMHSCPACSPCVNAHGSASSRDKPQVVNRCVRSTKGTVRQGSSKAGGTTATRRTHGDCETSATAKALGAIDGKHLVQQAYLASLSDSSARTPGYAKPTKAALIRQACGSS